MRLSKSSTPAPLPFPIRHDSAPGDSEDVSGHSARSTTASPLARATSELVDLVANHRPDLLKTFLDVLHDSRKTREHTEKLIELIADCGVSEAASPCATSAAIAEDLEKLASSTDRWTHPAQIVRRPHVQALHRLCAARVHHEAGATRKRYESILPRLERAARLTEKAALRRVQEATRHPK